MKRKKTAENSRKMMKYLANSSVAFVLRRYLRSLTFFLRRHYIHQWAVERIGTKGTNILSFTLHIFFFLFFFFLFFLSSRLEICIMLRSLFAALCLRQRCLIDREHILSRVVVVYVCPLASYLSVRYYCTFYYSRCTVLYVCIVHWVYALPPPFHLQQSTTFPLTRYQFIQKL